MNGLIIGKFMPLHKGHCFLIEMAIEMCEFLYLCICSKKEEPIAGVLRFSWLQQQYPHKKIKIFHITKEIIDAHAGLPNAPKIWSEEIRAYIKDDIIDYVFASENYGNEFARQLGAKFVPVDPNRTIVPVSGKEIRHTPYKYWKYLANPVKAYYTKLIGVEGTQLQVQMLAETLGALYYTPYSLSVRTHIRVSDWTENQIKDIISAEVSTLRKQDHQLKICHLPPAQEHNNLLVYESTLFDKLFVITQQEDINMIIDWWRTIIKS